MNRNVCIVVMLLILLLAIALAYSGSIMSDLNRPLESIEARCRAKTGTLPHETECNAYYECPAYEVKTCNFNQCYDETSGTCVTLAMRNCPRCHYTCKWHPYRPNFTTGNRPNLFDCDTFFACHPGNILQLKCSVCFDRVSNQCIQDTNNCVCANDGSASDSANSLPLQWNDDDDDDYDDDDDDYDGHLV